MHPEVQQKGPGKCPKCGMTLEANASGKNSEAKALPSNQPEDHKNMKM
jgi:hypothetical protein